MKKWFFLGIIALGSFSFSLSAGDCVSGNCVNGQGIMNFANGDKYIGEFKTERKSGYGIYHFINGDRYEGDFKDDYPDGHGKAYLANGNYYEGEFKNNFPNGKGTMLYHNGNIEILKTSKDSLYSKLFLLNPENNFYNKGGFCFRVVP